MPRTLPRVNCLPRDLAPERAWEMLVAYCDPALQVSLPYRAAMIVNLVAWLLATKELVRREEAA